LGSPKGWFSSMEIQLRLDENKGYSASNWSLDAPQTGQTQLSGRSSNLVPGLIPLSGSPAAGSYTYPHTPQTYRFMIIPPFFVSNNYRIVI
jgi:hypothetical protein